MPRTYVHKGRGQTGQYAEGQLEQALEAVDDGMTIRKAAETFGIPKSTIGDRISGRVTGVSVPKGRPPAMARSFEKKIVESVKTAARQGIGLTRKQILARTSTLCRKTKLTTGYEKFKAGKDWWEGVKKRHPELTVRKPERLTSTRARMMNEEVTQKYFSDLGNLLETLGLKDRPHSIWNCDEVGKSFEHDPVKVVCEKGANCLARTSSRSTNVTIMACVSASGKKMPPMFIVAGKTSKSLHGFNTELAPAGSQWAVQPKGWMTDDLGEIWFRDIFLRHCGPARPQLLVLDGHSSHESLSILQCAVEEDIHILALPPHTTHHLQPLDKAVFGPLNQKYNRACSEYLQENPMHQVNKWSFPGLIRKAWESAVIPPNIQSGFRSCGIYPFNQRAIPETAFAPSQPSDVPRAAATCTSDDSAATEQVIQKENVDPHVGELQPILDISDPTQLLNWIQSSEVTCEALTDQEGEELCMNKLEPMEPAAELISSPSGNDGGGMLISTPLTTSNVLHSMSECNTFDEVNCFPGDDIKSHLLPTVTALKSEKRGKSITSHRLLTSQEIVNEKLMALERKNEKLEKKRQSELKRSMKMKKPN